MKLMPARTLIVGCAVLALGIGGGIAMADVPSSTDDTITACMLKPGGTIRLINAEAGATCKKSEQKVQWNAEGQPGTDGDDGADGVSGYERVQTSETRDINIPGSTTNFNISCPGDKVAVGGGGGGGVTPAGGGPSQPLAMGDTFANSDGSWAIGLRKLNGGNFVSGETATAFKQAICVNALP